jgi:hypothetical protein
VIARVYCETCCREVSAAHRLPETNWLHRVSLLLEGAQHRPKFTEGVNTMPKAKTPIKRPPKSSKAAVKETPKV